jgi:hypothetical protein
MRGDSAKRNIVSFNLLLCWRTLMRSENPRSTNLQNVSGYTCTAYKMMKTTRQNKFLSLTFVALLGLGNNAVPQNTKPLTGKYCEDLGFGWKCVDFKANGKCKITAGHSLNNLSVILITSPKCSFLIVT